MYIPLLQLPNQKLSVILGGQNCTISLYWRQERLYLDLTCNASVVCKGAVCQDRVDIVQSPSRYFSGSLFFLDLQGDRPPHWQELGTRYVLAYEPQERV